MSRSPHFVFGWPLDKLIHATGLAAILGATSGIFAWLVATLGMAAFGPTFICCAVIVFVFLLYFVNSNTMLALLLMLVVPGTCVLIGVALNKLTR